MDTELLEAIAAHPRCRSLLGDLASVFQAAPFPEKPTAQLAFRFGQLAPDSGPIQEADLLRCDHFRCLLPARTCLMRQAAKWPSKSAPVFAHCASGECEQGTDYRRRAPWDPRAFWSKGRYSFYRKDSREQHMARKQLVASGVLSRRSEEFSAAAELVMLNQGAATAVPRRG